MKKDMEVGYFLTALPSGGVSVLLLQQALSRISQEPFSASVRPMFPCSTTAEKWVLLPSNIVYNRLFNHTPSTKTPSTWHNYVFGQSNGCSLQVNQPCLQPYPMATKLPSLSRGGTKKSQQPSKRWLMPLTWRGFTVKDKTFCLIRRNYSSSGVGQHWQLLHEWVFAEVKGQEEAGKEVMVCDQRQGPVHVCCQWGKAMMI